MTRYTFGEALDEEDILELQGVEYTMQPIGMKAMRGMLKHLNSSDVDKDTEGRLDAAIDLLTASIVPEQRDKFREQIDNSVGPKLLTDMALKIMGQQTDVDPTLLASSSAGSEPTGSSSTAGAEPEALTPST
jgi:hypothetical protein